MQSVIDFFRSIPRRVSDLWATYRSLPRNRQLIIGGATVAGVLLLVVIGAVAFGGGSPTPTTLAATTTTTATSTTTSTTTTTTTTTTLPLGPASPLNGLAAEDPLTLDRRVIAVKIDNHADSRPQSGIQDADLIFELPVEGITRFIALFHDNDSDYLGPIRSGRPTDPTLIRPFGATFIISGAQSWIQAIIRADGVDRLEEPAGTFRINTRSAPHNLYGDTPALRETADQAGFPDTPPPEYWPIGPFQGTESAPEVFIEWGPGDRVLWQWDGTQYLRFHNEIPFEYATEDGTRSQVGADVLVVLDAKKYTASPATGSGSPVPAMETTGTGRALVFWGALAIEGTWSRSDIEQPFELTLPDGSVMLVPPGRPWVSIHPNDLAVIWGEDVLASN